MLTATRQDRAFAYLAVPPACLVLAALLVYPIVYSLILSFSRLDGLSMEFAGLANYAGLLQDEDFWRVLLNNFIFLVSRPAHPARLARLRSAYLRAGLGLAGVPGHLLRPIRHLGGGDRLLFRNFFAFDGPVNQLLGSFGMPPVDWMSSGSTAIAVILLALVWSSFGYGMLILSLGWPPSIPMSMRRPGSTARAGHSVRDITLPLIAKPMSFLSIINVIYTFTSLFGFIFVMTSGGRPGYETTTVDYFIYLKAFVGFDLGAGRRSP